MIFMIYYHQNMMTYKKLTTNIFPVSCYANLEDYHINEEQHAYYVDMRAELLRRLDQYHKEAGHEISVLELGAGTGLLTKLLAERSGIKLTVLEPDERSRLILARVLKGSSVKIISDKAEDLAMQNSFDVIISSFSHDHVKSGSELAQTIARALKPVGVYLCGMEVLRSYRTEKERILALKLWHGFVIKKAEKDGFPVLVGLEHEALLSGIHRIADFKRDEKRFETEMSEARLNLIEKSKMGPLRPANIGGVFVYLFQK